MNDQFSTQADTESMAAELSCMKALVTYMLKAMGQADAGRVIVRMERDINEMGETPQSEVFKNTITQIKSSYRK